MNQAFVYILASQRNGTLYTGMRNDLARRVWEHRTGSIEGFTKRYGVHRLVYYEVFIDPLSAIRRENCIKKCNRAWKIQMIEDHNPDWWDLYLDLNG